MGKELQWFESYLDRRKKTVSCNGKITQIREISIGVPEGSVLGPILFLIYINNLTQFVDGATINIFADDVSFYTTRKTVQEVESKLQDQVASFGEWYDTNELCVTTEKSHVLFGCIQNVTGNYPI